MAELAHHFFEAGPVGDQAKTVGYATQAGTEAVGTLAYEEAVRLFKMALHSLQESPDERRRCVVLVLLGDAQARAGDQLRSKDTFLAAAAIAGRIDDADLLARERPRVRRALPVGTGWDRQPADPSSPTGPRPAPGHRRSTPGATPRPSGRRSS